MIYSYKFIKFKNQWFSFISEIFRVIKSDFILHNIWYDENGKNKFKLITSFLKNNFMDIDYLIIKLDILIKLDSLLKLLCSDNEFLLIENAVNNFTSIFEKYFDKLWNVSRITNYLILLDVVFFMIKELSCEIKKSLDETKILNYIEKIIERLNKKWFI